MIYARYKRWQMEQERLDYRAGLIAAEIRNTLRSEKNRKVWKASDFMPERTPQPKVMTTEQTVNYVAALNRLLGGVDLREPVG